VEEKGEGWRRQEKGGGDRRMVEETLEGFRKQEHEQLSHVASVLRLTRIS
jgi:hypothetical protein